MYIQFVFNKSVKVSGEKKTLFNKIKISFDIIPHTMHKIKLQWITDLGIKAKTLKLLEENIEKYFYNSDMGIIS